MILDNKYKEDLLAYDYSIYLHEHAIKFQCAYNIYLLNDIGNKLVASIMYKDTNGILCVFIKMSRIILILGILTLFLQINIL